MNNFLDDLYEYSLKYLTKQEAKELKSFYEEIINERLSAGEKIDNILKDYDKKEIIKETLPEVILKRDKNSFKSFFHVLLVLFSTPILIPLAVVYLALIVVALSMVIVGFSLVVSGLITIIPYSYQVITYSSNVGATIGLLALGLFAGSFVALFGYYFGKIFIYISKAMSKGILKSVIRRRNQHENL